MPQNPDSRTYAGRRYRFREFVFEPDEQRLWRGDRPVHLPPKPFDLLRALVETPGRLLRKEELLERVWPDTFVSDAVLKTTVRQLRAVLEDDPAAPWAIDTVVRSGYRFIAPLAVEGGPELEPDPAARRSSPVLLGGAALAPPPVGPEVVVGRDDDLAALLERCAQARAGGRQLVFLSGEAGIGKSTLLDLLERRVRDQRGWQIGRGQALEQHGEGEAFAPLLQALETLCDGDPSGDVLRTARRHAASWVAQIAWLADEPADEPSRPLPAGTAQALLESRAPRERMLREMAELLERLASTTPLLLLLEDLHWSDPSTLDLLSFLARRRGPARLAIVATLRGQGPDARERRLPSLLQDLARSGQCSEIALQPLSDRHVANYLERRTDSDLVAAIAVELRDRTGGHPLFVRAIVDDWLERRALSGGRPVEALLSDVPADLRPMIERQLDGVPAEVVDLLELASFLGDDFTSTAVAALTDRPADELETALDALAREGRMIRGAGTARLDRGTFAGRYAFRHSLDRDVLRERVSAVRRARIHADIAGWLETRDGDLDAAAGEIAHHLAHAGPLVEPERLVRFARVAAARALRLCAYAEAVSHLRVALDASAPAGGTRVELLVELSDALRRTGDPAASETTAREAVRLARDLVDPLLFGRALLQLGASFQTPGMVDHELRELAALIETARAWLAPEGPSALPDSGGTLAVRASLAARLAFARPALPASAPERSALLAEARDLAARSGDPKARLFVQLFSHWALWGPGEIERREREAAELLGAAIENGEAELEHIARASRITCLFELGRFDDVDGELRRCLAISEEFQQPWYTWAISRFVVARDLMGGRFVEAEHGIFEALQLGQRFRIPAVQRLFGGQMAMLRLAQGRSAEILPSVGSLDAPDARPSIWTALLAVLEATGGEPFRAHGHLQRAATGGFGELPRDGAWLTAMAFLAEAAARVGDAASAATLREQLAPHAELCVVAPYGLACLGPVSRYLALLQECLGDRSAARQGHEATLAFSERVDAVPWIAQARLDLGRCLLTVRSTGSTGSTGPTRSAGPARASRSRRAPTARSLIQSAREIGARLGMQRLASEADDLLASVS